MNGVKQHETRRVWKPDGSRLPLDPTGFRNPSGLGSNYGLRYVTSSFGAYSLIHPLSFVTRRYVV